MLKFCKSNFNNCQIISETRVANKNLITKKSKLRKFCMNLPSIFFSHLIYFLETGCFLVYSKNNLIIKIMIPEIRIVKIISKTTCHQVGYSFLMVLTKGVSISFKPAGKVRVA